MILINLLPHREVARKRRKDLFNVSLVHPHYLAELLLELYSFGIKLPSRNNKVIT